VKTKKKPQAKRYYLFQCLANWTVDPDTPGGKSFTRGGLIGDINAFSQKDALEQAVEKYPNFRGLIQALPYGEPVDEEKWYPCLEEAS